MQPSINPDGTVNTVPKEMWVNEKKIKRCQMPDCNKDFGFFTKKQHCNACGRLCCAECANAKASMPPAFPEPTNVCMNCFTLLQQRTSIQQAARRQARAAPVEPAPAAPPAEPTATTAGRRRTVADVDDTPPPRTPPPAASDGRTPTDDRTPPAVAAASPTPPSSDKSGSPASDDNPTPPRRQAEDVGDKPPTEESSPSALPLQQDVKANADGALYAASETTPTRETIQLLSEAADSPQARTLEMLQEVQRQIQELEAKALVLREENTHLAQRVTEAEEERNLAQRRLDEAREAHQQQLAALQQSHAEAEAARAAASVALPPTEPEVAAEPAAKEVDKEALLALEAREAAVAQQEAALQEREAKLSKERQRLSESEAALKANQKALSKEQHEWQALRDALAVRERSVEDLTARNEQLQSKLEAVETAAATQRNAEADFLAEKERRLALQQADILAKLKECDERERELSATITTLASREGELKEREDALQASRAEHAAAVEQLEERAQNLRTAQEQSRTEAEVAAHAVANAHHAEEIAKRDAHLTELTKALHRLEAERDAVVVETQALTAALQQKDAIIDESHQVSSTLRDKVDRVTNELNALKQQQEEASAQAVAEVSKALAAKEETMRGLEENIHALMVEREGTAKQHSTAISALKKTLDDRESDMAREVQSLKSQLDEARALGQSRLESLERQAETLRLREATLTAKTQELDAAQLKLKQAQDDVVADRLRAQELLREAEASAKRSYGDEAAAMAAERAVLEGREAQLAEERVKLESFAATLKARDEALADGARRAEVALRTRAEELRERQAQLAEDVRRFEEERTQSDLRSAEAAAKLKEASLLRENLSEQTARLEAMKADIRDKLAAIAAESQKLAQLRKETNTPRTPILAGAGVGRFAVAPLSHFRPFDPPAERRGDFAVVPFSQLPFAMGEWVDLAAHLSSDSTGWSANPLSTVAYHAAEAWKLLDVVVPALTWGRYLRCLEQHFTLVPYHNALRAAQVLANAVAVVDRNRDLFVALTLVEKFALLFSLATLGVGHPGYSNGFLARCMDPVAIGAHFVNISEHASLDLAFAALLHPRLDATTLLSEADLGRFTQLVGHLVTSTSVTNRLAVQGLGAALVLSGTPQLQVEEVRCAMLTLVVTAADSLVTHEVSVQREWEARLQTEAELQHDKEAELGSSSNPTDEPGAMVAALRAHRSLLAAVLVKLWPSSSLASLSDASKEPTSDMVTNAKLLVTAHSETSALEAENSTLRSRIVDLEVSLAALNAELGSRETSTAPHDVRSLVEQLKEQRAKLDAVEGILDQIASSEEGLATFLQNLKNEAMKRASIATGNEDDPDDDRAFTADAYTVMALREATARQKMAEASQALQAVAQREAEVASALRKASDLENEAQRLMKEASLITNRLAHVEKMEAWIQSQWSGAMTIAARELAVTEASTRLTAAAEELEARRREVERRVEVLTGLEAQSREATSILKHRSAREAESAAAVEASRDRRRRVAQARVLQMQREAHGNAPEPWLLLERQIYSLTDVIAQVAEVVAS